MSGIVTLTTDWGIKDAYVAIFKAAVLRKNPKANIVDVSHQSDKFGAMHAAKIISQAYGMFPEGTVHVVDVREISSEDRERYANKCKPYLFLDPIGVKVNHQILLMENNGLLSLILSDWNSVEEVVKLTENDEFSAVSTFNALNFYSLAAARLSSGEAKLSEVGVPYPKECLVRLNMPKIVLGKDYIECRVSHVDDYGNLVTNLSREDFEQVADGRTVMDVELTGCESFKEVPLKKSYLPPVPGKIFAVFNLAGYLELGLRYDSLAAICMDSVRAMNQQVIIRFRN